MKKILVLFLAIIVVCAGIGFAASSTLNTGDPGSDINYISQNDGIPSTNTAQNDGNDVDNSGQDDGNQGGTDLNNGQDDWYDGFWDDKNNGNDGFWKGDNKDHKDKDKDKKDDEDNDKFKIEINNYISAAATGGNAESSGGNSESNVESKSASSNMPQQIAAEIEETNGGTVFIEEIPMQKTGLPVAPALLSTLLISSGLLYRKLRK